MVRYPHTGTFHWKTGGSQNDDDGIFTPGTAETKTVDCSVQPNGAGFRIDVGGDKVEYKFKIYCGPVSVTIPDTSEFEYNSVKYKVLRIFQFQKHFEAWV